MIETHAERDPLDQLAESFLERYRAGECPSLTEYTERYPELAEEIRELFPALVVMEKARPKGGESDNVPEESDQAIPAQLGDYHILREVGRGGMGVVFEAVQESLHRHVALKVLPFHSWVKPKHLERFQREAQAAARLHHTNIVPVFGVGAHEGIHFYAMQFIQGQGLDAVLEEVKRLRGQQESTQCAAGAPRESLALSVAESLFTGRFSSANGQDARPGAAESSPAASSGPVEEKPQCPETGFSPGSSTPFPDSHAELSSQSEVKYFRSVAQIGVQVAEALAYAHRQGVLHRDIKPSNLMLDTVGRVWITDFGLAKTDDSDELTNPGDMVGTLRYMAPERFQGRADPRSDVYGLGITLYEMLTLRQAFGASNRHELIEQITHTDAPLPHKADPKIPRDLETVVLKAIAKEPDRRYATAEAMAEDLRRVLADRPIHARRSSTAEQVWRWCRRNPAVASLAAAALVLVVAVAIISALAASRLGKEQTKTLKQLQLTQRAETQATNAKNQALQAEQVATRRLFRSLVEQARASRYSRRLGQRFKSLEVLAEAARIARDRQMAGENFLELRNEVIGCLALPDLRVAREWPGWPAGSFGLDFDGKLERYARVDRGGKVSVGRVPHDAKLAPLPAYEPNPEVRFSPDGQFLALGHASGPRQVWKFKVWKLSGQDPLFVPVPIEETARGSNAFDFSPDSRQLAVGHENGSISLYDLTTGQRLRNLKAGAPPWRLAFHPTKPLLAVTSHAVVEIRDLTDGKVVAQLPHVAYAYPWAAWHPDGKTLATVGGEQIIFLWDVSTGKQIGRLEGPTGGGITFTFNHAGNLLASTSWDSMLRLWDWRTGKMLFSTQATVTRPLHFSPDDHLLAAEVIGNKLRIWEVTTGRGYRTLVRDPILGKTECFTTAIDRDGRLLVVGTKDGFGLWDLKSNEELRFIRLPGINHVLFEPSGALLTNGEVGLLRWPFKVDAASPGLVRVGPPQKLPLPGTPNQIARSRDGRVVASAQYWGAHVLFPDRPPVSLSPHEDVRYLAVSPDGRWVATGSHGESPLVKVWEAETGKLEQELAAGSSGQVAFSPDGKWLATTGDGLRLWATGSWQQRLRFESRPLVGLAFSPDSRMLAFETGYGVIRLIDPDASGEKEWARLEDPDQHQAGHINFSPDGTQLIKTGGNRIAIWDVRAIRETLATRGLDWRSDEWPVMSDELALVTHHSSLITRLNVQVDLGILKPRTAGDDNAREVARYSLAIALQPINPEAYYRRALARGRLKQWQVALDDFSRDILLRPNHGEAYSWRGQVHSSLKRYAQALADFNTAIKLLPPDPYLFYLRGDAHHRLHNYDEAAADYHRTLALKPAYALACNQLAWLTVTAPVSRRAPDQALLLAQRAVRLEPKNWNYRNTLGVVQYHLGQWDAAVDSLERAIQDNPDGATANDLFFLAMSYHHLGDRRKARDSFDKALQWQQAHPDITPLEKEELRIFCSETEALLGGKLR
jgi:serine/threonine protein kinase/WD40 repeat protein/Flp pilus assembly protein TadD